MKITRTEITPLTPRSSFDAQPEKKVSTSRGAVTTETSLSPEIKELNQARSLLASTSDVDMDKISAMKKAIAEGKLPLDMEALGSAILEMHR